MLIKKIINVFNTFSISDVLNHEEIKQDPRTTTKIKFFIDNFN